MQKVRQIYWLLFNIQFLVLFHHTAKCLFSTFPLGTISLSISKSYLGLMRGRTFF